MKQRHFGHKLCVSARFGSGALLGLAVLVALSIASAAWGQSKTTAYVRIVTSHGPIAGAAKDPGHQGWIPCREASEPSVSEITATNDAMATSSATRKAAAPGVRGTAAGEPASRDMATGQASGKRRWAPLRIVKEIDASSPKLSQLMTAGEVIPEVDLELYRDEGGRMVPSAKYKMSNAIVSGVQRMTGAGDRPLESVTFTFQKIEISR